MDNPLQAEAGSPQDRRVFRTTTWTVVATAAQPDSPAAQEALNQLGLKYWGPVYTYVRCRGYGEEDAKDLTQGFFFQILQKNFLRGADRTKGKFRSFLLTALKHYMSNERERARAAKRGGEHIHVSLDAHSDQEDPPFEVASDLSPEKIFEREWAKALFRQVEAKLRHEYALAGKGPLFDRLREFVDARADPGEYEAVAAELNMTPGAVAVAVHRLRHRLGDMARAEVAETLLDPTPAAIEAERQHLFDLFALKSPG